MLYADFLLHIIMAITGQAQHILHQPLLEEIKALTRSIREICGAQKETSRQQKQTDEQMKRTKGQIKKE